MPTTFYKMGSKAEDRTNMLGWVRKQKSHLDREAKESIFPER